MNAGHNAPIVFADGLIKSLEVTGLPLGLFIDAEYEAKAAPLNPGDSPLLFTDGLTDSIASDDPELRVQEILKEGTDLKKQCRSSVLQWK